MNSSYSNKKLKVGIIGVGYWGPNFVRNFIRHKSTDLAWVCDLSPLALNDINQLYPQIKTTQNYLDLIKDSKLDLIMIATPPMTHYKLAKAVLDANKHLIVAKPLTTNSKQAEKLINLAKEKKLLIHGDLTYLYTGAVKYIHDAIQTNKIGLPMYYDSTRSNLGLIQRDVNVIWDLAPHDLAILEYCFGFEAKKVFATASKHYGNSNNYEMAHISINYSSNFIAHIHVSWVSPIKLRTILVGGTKKMIFYDDIEPDEKIKVYDKGIEPSVEDVTYTKPIYRSGDALIPKLTNEEAIFSEISEISQQILDGKISYNNAQLNLRIIKLLEACDISVKSGRPVLLK